MIHKLTNRTRLQNSEWLRQIKGQDWQAVQKPPADGLGIQGSDLTRPIDGDSAARRIREHFQRLVEIGIDLVASDGEMAAGIHRILDGITYREASDPDFWAYLVTFGCPEYPRWRWPKPDADLPNRYAGTIRRNAFAALWWWAEVSHDPTKAIEDPERYSQTRIVQGRTTFVMFCIDCAFSGHRLLMHNLCKLQQRNRLSDVASRKLCRSVNRMARTICLDGLSTSTTASDFSERAFALSALIR